MRQWAVGWVCMAFFVVANSSFAQSITFNYEAMELGGNGILAGTFVVDTGVLDTLPTPELGAYPNAGQWTGQITSGDLDGRNFQFAGADITIFNASAPPFDSFTMSFGGSSVLISDLSGTAFETDALPTSFDLTNFDVASLLVNSQDIGKEAPIGPPQTVLFTLTSVTAIPEPAHMSLLYIAAFAVATTRRRY